MHWLPQQVGPVPEVVVQGLEEPEELEELVQLAAPSVPQSLVPQAVHPSTGQEVPVLTQVCEEPPHHLVK